LLHIDEASQQAGGEAFVSRKNWFFLIGVLCFSLSSEWAASGFAADKVTPEEVVAAHLKALGSPQALASLKTLAFVGTAKVEFFQGMYGSMNGNCMLVSDRPKMSIVMKFGDINYPQEYFAYDGKEVSVGYISPGQRSPLADFIFRNNGIMKEGLLGGVLSGAWPLLNLEERQVDLKYDEDTIDGRKLRVIEYRPKQNLRNMKIKLYFDKDTYRHVRTEYRVRVRDDMTAAPGGGATRTGRFTTQTQSGPEATDLSPLFQGLPDSIYVLTESFDDFKKVGLMELPHKYTIDYSVEGQGSSFVGRWTMQQAQWLFNQAYDDRIFVAQK